MALIRCGAGGNLPSFDLLTSMILDENVECGNGGTYSVTSKPYDRFMIWNANSSVSKTSTISNIVGDVYITAQLTFALSIASAPNQKVRYAFIPAGASFDIVTNSTSGGAYDNTQASFYKFA